MLGRKEFTPKRFYEFSLEAQVPSDHLLRRIGARSTSALCGGTARFYSHTGRPGVDPVVLFKLMLLGYLYGITSERRLAEEARLHLAFRWFLGYDLDETPPGPLDAVQGAGALRPARVPGRLSPRWCAVRAGRPGAGRRPLRGQHAGQGQCQSWVGRRAGAAHSAAERAGYVATVWQENPVSDPTSPAPPPGEGEQPAPDSAGGLTAGARARPPLHVVGPEDVPNGDQGPVNALVTSRTDPDAGLVKREGSPTPSITRRTSAWTAGGRVSSPRWT